MKVGFFSQLSVKLFGLMSLLTLVIIGATAAVNLPRLQSVLEGAAKDQVLEKTTSISEQINSQVLQWVSLFAGSVSTLKVIDNRVDQDQLQKLLRINPEDVVAFQVYTINNQPAALAHLAGAAFSQNTDPINFEDRSPGTTYDLVKAQTKKWVESRASKAQEGSIMLVSLARQTNLLLANIAVAKKSVDGLTTTVMVLTVWQTKIVRSLEKGNDISVVVADRSGSVFSSIVTEEMTSSRSIADSPLFKKAQKDRIKKVSYSKQQQLEVYKYGNENYFGSFSRIPVTDDLTVFSQIDQKTAFAAMTEAREEFILAALLFILVAVFLSFVGASEITKGLVQVTRATNRIASGDFSVRVKPQSSDEVGVLGHAVNTMSEKIVDLMKTQVDKARIEQELETAKMVQSTFFPKHDIEVGKIKLAGFYQPATECGGDLWGHFTVRPGVELVYIADVMGHGAPAALVTAMAYSTCMTISDIMKEDHQLSGSPAKLLDRMNRIILEAVGGSISMTCFAVLIDMHTGKMVYSNAGHNFPAIIPLSADDSRSKKKKESTKPTPISLQLRGVPLGIDAAAEFTEKTIDLVAGDKLFFFTDGLIECSSPTGTVWGRKIMLEELVEISTSDINCGASEMRNEVSRRAFDFFGNNPLNDDVTILVAEIDRNWVISNAASDVPAIQPPTATIKKSPDENFSNLQITHDLLPSPEFAIEKFSEADAAALEPMFKTVESEVQIALREIDDVVSSQRPHDEIHLNSQDQRTDTEAASAGKDKPKENTRKFKLKFPA